MPHVDVTDAQTTQSPPGDRKPIAVAVLPAAIPVRSPAVSVHDYTPDATALRKAWNINAGGDESVNVP